MWRYIALSLLFCTNSYALEYPFSFPKAPLKCTYSGVFPGSGVAGNWTYSAAADGTFSVEITDAKVLYGLLERRVGKRLSGLNSWQFTGTERHTGSIVKTRYVLSADVQVEGVGIAVLSNIVDTELACRGFPRKVVVGDTWDCTETAIDSYEWKDSSGTLQPGTERLRYVVSYRYLKDQQVETDNGKVTAAIIVVTDDKGGKERLTIDPQIPWCPLIVERIKAEQVVGTDTLVAIQGEVSLPPAVGNDVPPEKHTLSWLMVVIAGLGLGVGIYLGRKHQEKIL